MIFGAKAETPDYVVPVCAVDAGIKAGSPGSDPNIRLGQALFYDPILSGAKGVACATCHHPRLATSDGVSLSLGDGGIGLGPARRADPRNLPEQRIPRNAQSLFNLGAPEFGVMFHDGRLETDPARPSGLRTPIGEGLGSGLSALAAQTMFPVLSPDEMAGHYGENDVASAVRRGLLGHDNGAWRILSDRVAAIPAYRSMFDQVIGAGEPIAFKAIARALEAFIAFEWRADDSPFDRHICAGQPMEALAQAGMDLFYGKAGCAECHSGRYQTDHEFHAIAMPQIGPGKAERFESHARDVGRMRVTGRAADAYRFRTPSLRNVTATSPYGHSGAFATLKAVIRHHLDPVGSLAGYDRLQAILPDLPGTDDFRVLNDPAEMAAIANANELTPQELTDREVAALFAFLNALTDTQSLEGRLGIPASIPSGLKLQ